MKTSTKVLVLVLVLAIPAFLLGKVIWPDPIGADQPTALQLPFFIFLSALEAIAFGIGVAFIVFGWPLFKNAMRLHGAGTKWAFAAIAWLMISWWPHDNMHRANGMDLAGLLRIEYIFHFTLIVSSLIVAWNFWKFLKRSASKNQNAGQ